MSDPTEEYRSQLYELYKTSGIQFDKNVLFMASGALGLSMSFISDIIDLQHACYKWMLGSAWLIMTIVILISLLSYYLSMKGIKEVLEDRELDMNRRAKTYNKVVMYLNFSMLVGLPVGIGFLIAFILQNI